MSNDRHTLSGWRSERGMRQEDLARLADVTLSTLAGIEQGRQHPRIDTVLRLCDALQIGVEQIIWPEYRPRIAKEAQP